MPTTQCEVRYLTTEELIRLGYYAEARALLDTLLSSGLRASKVGSLQAGDELLGYGQASLVVRQGKGDKQREVLIPQELRTHLKAFLAWKRDHGEDISDEAPVFIGQRGSLTRNGIWHVVKGLMAAVGLDPRYATHSCRHYSGSRTMPGGVTAVSAIACSRVARPA